jgi:hypothetical protein
MSRKISIRMEESTFMQIEEIAWYYECNVSTVMDALLRKCLETITDKDGYFLSDRFKIGGTSTEKKAEVNSEAL